MGQSSAADTSCGSQWHRWDSHIHTPSTLKADQYKGEDVWELYLQALEAASPPLAAIGVTDYGVTASYERLKAEKDSP